MESLRKFSNRIAYVVFFVFVAYFLTNCKSEKELKYSDNHSILTKEVISENVLIHIDEQQKMLNSDFQKFVHEAQEKIIELEKFIDSLESEHAKSRPSSAVVRVKTLEELYGRCEALKFELNDYIQNGTGNWVAFKQQYYKKVTNLHTDCARLDLVANL